ncbi:hypothetical protein GCM10010276_16230 [Streptomyces longisporus]|uniref:Uncharacterized protein n=1 Tax=Streptomyces longisporus TaxID=1948 RepID=A0ABN3L9M6_STRLO
MTFETVIGETPAAFATSWIVVTLTPGLPSRNPVACQTAPECTGPRRESRGILHTVPGRPESEIAVESRQASGALTVTNECGGSVRASPWSVALRPSKGRGATI